MAADFGVGASARAASAGAVAAPGNTGNWIGGSGGKKLANQLISPWMKLSTPVWIPVVIVGPIRSNSPSIRYAVLYTRAWVMGWMPL